MLVVSNVSKSYSQKQALNNVSLHIENGAIYGILGPNGSGKTTLMRIIAGILTEYDGCVHLKGSPVSDLIKADIAYLPEDNHLYDFMSAAEAADFYQSHFPDFDANRFQEICETFHINRKTKIGALSKGMLQQLRIGLVLSRKASLYLFDEPLNGIDIITRDKIISLIRSSIRDNCCMLLTSHLVNEIEQLLDKVHFLNAGRTILVDSADDARVRYGKSIENIYREVMSDEKALVV